MKNVFFDIALKRASKLLGNNGRIMLLLTRLGTKMASVNWKEVSVRSAKEKFSIFSRLSKAYVSGQYKEIPWKTLMSILAAIIYFVNPLDLIPDFIPGLGLTDDFSVLIWVYSSASQEINKFLEWERSTLLTK